MPFYVVLEGELEIVHPEGAVERPVTVQRHGEFTAGRFEADVLACPRCGGRMIVLATIEAPAVIRRILTHLGLSMEAGEHPLLRRIMQIHVTEEARHLCFARRYLREHVARLGSVRRAWLALRAPMILGVMAQMMLRPSRHVVRTYGIPRGVIRAAYTRNPQHREATIASLERTHALCRELGLITPWSLRVWQVFGIWPAPQVA